MNSKMKKTDLQKHIFTTYINMRYGVAIIAIIFPLLLWFGGGFLYDLERQDSMSAYYHADIYTLCDQEKNVNDIQCSEEDLPECCADIQNAHNGFMRNYFVGLLFMIGGIFYLYKGYSKRENTALNLAGIFAICVALFPMQWGSEPAVSLSFLPDSMSLHGIFAVSMFLCIAFVCLICAPETLHRLNNLEVEKKFKFTYWVIGSLMIISPAIAWLLAKFFDDTASYVFFAEMTGIWVFALYWLTKSYEITKTNAETEALTGFYE